MDAFNELRCQHLLVAACGAILVRLDNILHILQCSTVQYSFAYIHIIPNALTSPGTACSTDSGASSALQPRLETVVQAVPYNVYYIHS